MVINFKIDKNNKINNYDIYFFFLKIINDYFIWVNQLNDL